MPIGVKPLIGMGQDESIFRQYSFSHKSWTSPDGQKAIIPKDSGTGVMISAFVSREFGYGMDLSTADLEQINSKRNDEMYQDKEASKNLQGTACKKALTKSPFTNEFEYGSNNHG